MHAHTTRVRLKHLKETNMLTNTKFILAAALLLATTGTVLANDIDQSASGAQVERDWQDYLNSIRAGRGTTAFGYHVAPSQNETTSSHKQNRSR
jgi:hypothetical protein